MLTSRLPPSSPMDLTHLAVTPSTSRLMRVYVGIALVVNTFWPIMFLPVGIALLHYRVIAREESYLERVIGDEYRQYKARVRRWV